jgi:DNA recombination protein RmuC
VTFALVTTLVVLLALVLAGALGLLWRMYRDSLRRAEEAGLALAAERDRSERHRSALQRYEVAFSSARGRGELGEHVLADTARSLGLRDGLHFTLQPDVAGGGAARTDLVLLLSEGRQVPVDAKASLAVWAEAVETDDPSERAEALRVHARNVRSRVRELASKDHQRWADAVYGTIMFLPSDAALTAALDSDPELLGWLLARRVFPCGPTGFAVAASAALFTASERVLAADIDAVRTHALEAHRAASAAVEAANVSGTHLQRLVAARRREIEALERFRGAVAPLGEAAASPAALPALRAGSAADDAAAEPGGEVAAG